MSSHTRENHPLIGFEDSQENHVWTIRHDDGEIFGRKANKVHWKMQQLLIMVRVSSALFVCA
jgi:hypothetical protein